MTYSSSRTLMADKSLWPSELKKVFDHPFVVNPWASMTVLNYKNKPIKIQRLSGLTGC